MRKRNLLAGSMLALLVMLGISGTAHASDYTGDCAGVVVFNGSGNVNITDSTCILPVAIDASGYVHIAASGAISATSQIQAGGEIQLSGTSVSTADVISENNIDIEASEDLSATDQIQGIGEVRVVGKSVNVRDVTSTGNKLHIEATDGDVATESIRASGTSLEVLAPSGKIQVGGDYATGTNTTQIYSAKANISLPQVVDSNGDVRIFANSGTSATVPFTIGTSGDNGVTSIENNGTYGYAIYVTNGSGSGGITYSGDGNLQVQASSDHSGSIFLDGQSSGNVTLSGSFNVDGAGGQGSGAIEIYSPQVIANGVTLGASASGANVGYINLITNLVTIDSGLTVNINGNGPLTNYLDFDISPVGSHTVIATTDPMQPIIFGPYAGIAAPVTVTGAGNLVVNANGNTNGVEIIGYPLTLNPASTTFTQNGSDNEIFIQSTDANGNFTELTLGGQIVLNEQTTSSGDNPGTINVDGTSVAALTGHVLLNAAGTNDGAGGTINLTPSDGSVTLGATGNSFALNADGGSSGGKGGAINTNFGGTLAITVTGGTAVTASAKGGNADGGTINMLGQTVSIASATIAADANGTGAAGVVNVQSLSGDTALSITGSTISATGNGDGSTQNVEIHAGADLSIDSSSAIDASSTGNQGGQILASFGEYNADKTLTWSGIVNAKAASGVGGTISGVSPTNGNIVSNAEFDASVSGSGTGGSLSLITSYFDSDNSISMPTGSINVSGSSSSTLGSIIFQAGTGTGATVSVSIDSLLGKVQATGTDVSIATSQSAASGDLTVSSIAAYAGDIHVASSLAKITVLANGSTDPAIQAWGDVNLLGNGIDVALGASSGNDSIQAYGSDSPGNITLETTNTSNNDITVGSDIMADGLTTVSTHGNGNVLGSGGIVRYVNLGADNALHVSAQSGSIGNIVSDIPLKTRVKTLTASTSTSGPGVIDIANSLASGDDTLNVSDTSSGGDVHIINSGLLSVSDITVDSGKITLAGNGVTILDTSTGLAASDDIEIDTLSGSDENIELVGNVSTGATVTLQAQGVGDILTDGGMVGPNGPSLQPALVLRTGDGSVGLISNKFSTSVRSIDAFGSSLTGGSIHLKNETGVVHSTITLNDVIYANSLDIENDGPIVIFGNIESSSIGDIEIFSDVGTVNDQSSQILAFQGNIRLYTLDTSGGLSGSAVQIGLGASVIADEGDIFIFRGARDPAQQAGIAAVPPILSNGGQVFWGGPYGNPPNQASITASGQQIFVAADGATVTFLAAGIQVKSSWTAIRQ